MTFRANEISATTADRDPSVRLLLWAALGFAVTLAAAMPGAALGERAKVIGKTQHTPEPSCPAPPNPAPAEECQVLGHVTGFQVKADGKENLFKVREAGRIVGWSVDLSRPDREERNFFEARLGSGRFGDGPTGRISILKKVDRAKYKLTKQSPVVKLGSSLGEMPIITMNKPLGVQEGRVVALTTPSWLTNFAHRRQGQDEVWRASRDPDRCEGLTNLTERSRPHQKVGDVRRYGCRYVGARLLYWAYFVPD